MQAPVQSTNAAPERSLDQRMEALKRANDIRSKRAQLKRDLKANKVKTNRILNQCRISPSKTIGGLSERQRAELVAQLRK
jgi:hypothetical protein